MCSVADMTDRVIASPDSPSKTRLLSWRARRLTVLQGSAHNLQSFQTPETLFLLPESQTGPLSLYWPMLALSPAWYNDVWASVSVVWTADSIPPVLGLPYTLNLSFHPSADHSSTQLEASRTRWPGWLSIRDRLGSRNRACESTSWTASLQDVLPMPGARSSRPR